MRRLLVIFLILLFPLNVFALSMSVSMVDQGGAPAHALAAVDGVGCEGACDIDPDEPRSAADLHDILHQDHRPCLAGAGAWAQPAPEPARCCHSLPPPIKPPRLA